MQEKIEESREISPPDVTVKFQSNIETSNHQKQKAFSCPFDIEIALKTWKTTRIFFLLIYQRQTFSVFFFFPEKSLKIQFFALCVNGKKFQRKSPRKKTFKRFTNLLTDRRNHTMKDIAATFWISDQLTLSTSSSWLCFFFTILKIKRKNKFLFIVTFEYLRWHVPDRKVLCK